jgi:hypothetical protein
MVLSISESGMLLESSARASAQLPAQAFAIALSGSVIEDMIACVQNGGDIQLALGSSPVSIEAPVSIVVCYCLPFKGVAQWRDRQNRTTTVKTLLIPPYIYSHDSLFALRFLFTTTFQQGSDASILEIPL